MASRRTVRSVLAVLLLLALVASTALGDSSSTTTTTTTTISNTTSESFCEQCRDSGHCAQAYKGSPGIYCGAWLSAASQRLACCCPATGQCAKSQSNYECMCAGGSSTPIAATPKPSPASAASTNHTKYIIIAVAVFIVGAIALWLFFYCQRRNNERYSSHDETYIVQEPAAYAQPPPQPYAPQYTAQPSGYVVHHYHQDYYEGRGGGYSGATVAAGAAAGFLGGMLVGDMIADAGDGYGDGNAFAAGTYGDGGAGDGGMFAGDF